MRTLHLVIATIPKLIERAEQVKYIYSFSLYHYKSIFFIFQMIQNSCNTQVLAQQYYQSESAIVVIENAITQCRRLRFKVGAQAQASPQV